MNEKSEKCQRSVLGDTIKDENSLCHGDEPVLSSSLLRSGVPCEPNGDFQLWTGTAEGPGRVGTHSTRISGRGYNKEIREPALHLVHLLVIPPRAPKSTERDSVYALCFIALCTLCVPFIPLVCFKHLRLNAQQRRHECARSRPSVARVAPIFIEREKH